MENSPIYQGNCWRHPVQIHKIINSEVVISFMQHIQRMPYHDQRNQLTFLAKLSYYLEMVKGDDIYIISSQTLNYQNISPYIRPLKIENRVIVPVGSFCHDRRPIYYTVHNREELSFLSFQCASF